MEIDTIMLTINEVKYGVCLPINLNEDNIDSILSKVKARILENI